MKDENIFKNISLLVENFNDSGKLSNLKLINNSWSKIIDWSLNQGNQHFAITINFIDFNYDTFDINSINTIKEQDRLKNYLYEIFPTTTWVFIIFEKTKSNMLHLHASIAIRNFIDYNYILKNNLINSLLSFPFFNDQSLCYIDIHNNDIKVQTLNYFKDIKN